MLDDAPAIAAVLAEPEVAHWWGEGNDQARVRADISGGLESWAIVLEGHVVGWLHVHEEPDEQFPSVAFDISIGAAGRGRGLGRAALRLAIAHFIAAGHHRFTIDPAAHNQRAIRCYEAVGFRPVGILRAYQRRTDGEGWWDGLLMDLLAGEFAAVG